MHGDAAVLVEALHGGRRQTHLDRLAHQLMRDAVVVTVDFDVVIDVDLGARPLGVLVASRRQRLHRRPVERLERARAAAGELLERPLVELGVELADRGVQLRQREELAVAQPCEHPALNQEHSGLHGSFITRFFWTRRQDRRAVVLREIGIRRGRVGLVAAGLDDRALEIIRHQQRRHRAHVLKGPDVRGDPVRQRLGPGRFDVRIVRGAEHADEDLRLADLAGAAVDDRARVAAVVDEQLVAGAVHLAHRARQPAAELVVVEAELAVAVGALAVHRLVLVPQQLQRHALALELLMDVGVIGCRVSRRARCRRAWEQQPFDRRLIEVWQQRPRQPDLGRPGQVLGDRPLRQPGRRGDLAVAQARLELEAKHVSYLAHGTPVGRHPRLPLAKNPGRIACKLAWSAASKVRSGASCPPVPASCPPFRWSPESGHDQPGITGHVRPESVGTIDRNGRARSSGISGHVGPEYAA